MVVVISVVAVSGDSEANDDVAGGTSVELLVAGGGWSTVGEAGRRAVGEEVTRVGGGPEGSSGTGVGVPGGVPGNGLLGSRVTVVGESCSTDGRFSPRIDGTSGPLRSSPVTSLELC